MTQAAKERLVQRLEDDVGEYLTGKHTKMVTKSLSEVLADFDVDDLKNGEVNKDLLESFLKAKQVEGKSEKTLTRYSYMIEKMLVSMGLPTETITTNDIRAYFGQEQARGLSCRSIDGLRNICSSYFGWLYRERLISQNPMANVTPIKYKKELQMAFSDAEVERLKRACKTAREIALVNFLRSTGCRISEVVALNWVDVDLTHMAVKVLGKGNKERTVFIDEITAESLKEYFAEREDSNPALFIGKRGRMTSNGVRALLNQIGERANVEHVHPHRFRRTLATMLADRGMPIQEVAAILGHANINTTMT